MTLPREQPPPDPGSAAADAPPVDVVRPEASSSGETDAAADTADGPDPEVAVPERFAEVIQSLATVGQLPLPERVEVFESAHSRLRDALTSIDEV